MTNTYQIPPGTTYTHCRDCYFADYWGTPKEQKGCLLGRIEKFEEQGDKVIGCDDGILRSLMVIGRVCTAWRSEKWAGEISGDDLDRMDRVYAELEIGCSFIIYAGLDATEADVINSLLSIRKQDPPAKRVIIVLHESSLDPRVFVRYIEGEEVNIPYDVICIQSECDKTFAIDEGVRKASSTYYTLGNAGYRWRMDYLERINRAINYHLIRVIALNPDENGNGWLCNTALHKKLLGGIPDRTEAIREILVAQGREDVLIPWKDLPCE